MKKGQMEIMGLVIIVILITLAIFFVVRFVVLKPAEDVTKPILDKELASNTISALLRATTGCKGQDVTSLLKDCAIGGTISCGTMNSCEYVNETIGTLLNASLNEWRKYYEFSVSGLTIDIAYNRSTCPGERVYSGYPIATDFGTTINIELYVC